MSADYVSKSLLLMTFHPYLFFKSLFCLVFKVKISDMQIQAVHKDLMPGEPVCAPTSVVVCEALISLVRSLHTSSLWTEVINAKLVQQLDKVSDLDVFVDTKDNQEHSNTATVKEGDQEKDEDLSKRTHLVYTQKRDGYNH